MGTNFDLDQCIAGRTAIGIPSHLYISGLSLADCVFSGRRAGESVARAGRSTTTQTAPLGALG